MKQLLTDFPCAEAYVNHFKELSDSNSLEIAKSLLETATERIIATMKSEQMYKAFQVSYTAPQGTHFKLATIEEWLTAPLADKGWDSQFSLSENTVVMKLLMKEK